MSTDVLLRSLERAERSLVALRTNPPLSAVIAVRESFDHPPREARRGAEDEWPASLHGGGLPEQRDGFAEVLENLISFGERIDLRQVSGVHGHYTLVVCVERGTPEPARSVAHLNYRGLSERLVRVLLDLPTAVRRRLGYADDFFGPNADWERALFHLAWHFPNHFCNGAARRFRMIGDRSLRTDGPEEWLQLWGARGDLDGPYPGLMFSVLTGGLDLVTASEYALELMREALRGQTATPEHRDANLRQIRLAFADLAKQTRDVGNWDLGAWFVRSDSSFHTRPAVEWAGVKAGGDTQELLALSRQCPAVEHCVLRGMWCPQFMQLADHAGSQLPRWPSTPYPAPLECMDTWAERLAHRRDRARQPFVMNLGDGRTQTVSGAEIAEWEWQNQTPFRGFSCPVTDDRGNAERWVGFVLNAFILRDPESLEVRLGPNQQEGAMVSPWNCIVTLPGMNLFEASVRVIDWMLGDRDPERSGLTDESGGAETEPSSSAANPTDTDPPPAPEAAGVIVATGANPLPTWDAELVNSGDGYYVRGFGGKGHFGNLAGFRDLQMMVRTPGRAVPWNDLDATLVGDWRSVQPTIEGADLKWFADEMGRLRNEIDTAEHDAERIDAERRLEELCAQVKSATDRNGQGRDINSGINKVRSRIWNRLKTIYEKFRTNESGLDGLAEHLTRSVRSVTEGFIYDPPTPAPRWRTEE